MKPFFSPEYSALDRNEEPQRRQDVTGDSETPSLRARIAIYDSKAAAPRIHDVSASAPGEFIERLATSTFTLAESAGSPIPYTVVREVVENLIHADFREIVISILESGRDIRFADQGPGIADKALATRPGYTTATRDMKRFIRGVGSGFPLVREFLEHSGGSLEVTDNLRRGTVVTLRAGGESSPGAPAEPTSSSTRSTQAPWGMTPDTSVQEPLCESMRLTTRQKKVLSLIMEVGSAGPTLVSSELKVGLSTAHRDLAVLESCGLIESDGNGKRGLTDEGSAYLDDLFA